jgi:trans-aconitate 2-methyltransferase
VPDPSKDFTPIRDDYEFFAENSTEAAADLDAYAGRLRSFDPPAGTVRMLDFGCGPGSFTARFLGRLGWVPDRLDLALVEPSAAYRRQAVERLGAMTGRPVRAWDALAPDSLGAFDLILSNHALYYVPELPATLERIVKALGPGGLFLAAVAGRDNALVDLWFRGFPLIGQPVPYHTAEDVEGALTGLGVAFERRDVGYELSFPDTEGNRLKILRFLFGEHLAGLPRDELLGFFGRYASAGRVEVRTGDVQYYVKGGS